MLASAAHILNRTPALQVAKSHIKLAEKGGFLWEELKYLVKQPKSGGEQGYS